MTEPAKPAFGIEALATAKIMGTATADAGMGRVAGAVYRPVELIVPTEAFPFATPFTLQTMALVDPVSLERNWRLVPSRTVAEVGEIAIVAVEELLLPQPARTRPITNAKQGHANHAFMLVSPIFHDLSGPCGARASLIQNVRLTVKRKVVLGSKKLILCVLTRKL